MQRLQSPSKRNATQPCNTGWVILFHCKMSFKYCLPKGGEVLVERPEKMKKGKDVYHVLSICQEFLPK